MGKSKWNNCKKGLEKSFFFNYKKTITLFRLDITFNLPKRKTQSRKEQLRFAVLLTDSCLLSFFLITLQHVIPLLIQYIYIRRSQFPIYYLKKNTHTLCSLSKQTNVAFPTPRCCTVYTTGKSTEPPKPECD